MDRLGIFAEQPQVAAGIDRALRHTRRSQRIGRAIDSETLGDPA